MQRTVICKDVFGNEYVTKVDDLTLSASVYAVIIKDNKMLLTKQWDGYSMVGGAVEKGETLEEAMIRETKEETGLTVTPGILFHQQTSYFQKDAKSIPKQALMLYFDVISVSGDIAEGLTTESENEYTYGAAEWVDLKELGTITFRHTVKLDDILDAYRRTHTLTTSLD